MKPLVSVCCITYNQEKYVEETLKGFLIQKTSFPIEILIHDDASTDNTAKILRKYEEMDDRISVIYQTENKYSKGEKPFIKYLFPKAKGKYIAMCEGDDYWTDPLKLRKQVDFLEENDDVVMSFHDRCIIRNDGKKETEVNRKLFNIKESYKILNTNVIHQLTPTLTMMFKTTAIKDFLISYPDKEKIFGGDAFLRAYLSTKGKLAYLNFTGATYRVHEGGIHSSSNIISQKEKAIQTRVSMVKHIKGLNKKNAYASILKFCIVIMGISLKENKFRVFFKYLKKTTVFLFKYSFS